MELRATQMLQRLLVGDTVRYDQIYYRRKLQIGANMDAANRPPEGVGWERLQVAERAQEGFIRSRRNDGVQPAPLLRLHIMW